MNIYLTRLANSGLESALLPAFSLKEACNSFLIMSGTDIE